MRDEDLKITALEGGYSIAVCGRANFEYAVPLRDLAGKLVSENWVEFDMENCETMDSTFMGVLTMLALKLRKNGKTLKLINAGEHLVKLLRDLGVAKMFNFISDICAANGGQVVKIAESGLLAKAETVAEAHKALVGADSSNAERFSQVIEFAEQDVKRLREEEK